MTNINDMNKSMHTRIQTSEDGITLLITLLTMGVLLAVSASLLNITLKQYQLSGIAVASETAFQAASAGMECVQYHDFINGVFDVDAPRTPIQCFGENQNNGVPNGDDDNDTVIDSGEEQRFQFDWGAPPICTDVSIYKFFDADDDVTMILPNGENMDVDRDSDGDTDPCPAGSVCTVVQSRGYNVPCGNLDTPRVVEREYTQVY
jgi:hypothetical protein